MAKALVAYFSTHDTTGRVATKLAEVTSADTFEIVPAQPYTLADLNWQDKSARSTVEMNDPSARPAIVGTVANIADYDTVYVGFPIWWYREPRIIDTFLEAYDFSGKTIVPFCTSGSSQIGKTSEYLRELAPSATVKDGRRFAADVSVDELAAWVEAL